MYTPTPYSGKDKYIFISYSHRDTYQVFPIITKLMQNGYRVWFDAGIDPGTEWDENIAQHINECGYFIAFMSSSYLGSNNCKDELNYARDLEKERLIVYLEDVQLPAGLAMRVNRLQSIFKYTYANENDFYAKLFAAKNIETCCGQRVKEQTPPVQPVKPQTPPPVQPTKPQTPPPVQPVKSQTPPVQPAKPQTPPPTPPTQSGRANSNVNKKHTMFSKVLFVVAIITFVIASNYSIFDSAKDGALYVSLAAAAIAFYTERAKGWKIIIAVFYWFVVYKVYSLIETRELWEVESSPSASKMPLFWAAIFVVVFILSRKKSKKIENK